MSAFGICTQIESLLPLGPRCPSLKLTHRNGIGSTITAWSSEWSRVHDSSNQKSLHLRDPKTLTFLGQVALLKKSKCSVITQYMRVRDLFEIYPGKEICAANEISHPV